MNLFKRNNKTIIYCFCIGFALNSIPHVLDMVEKRKNARLEFLEKKILQKKQEKICKAKSNYSKFFEMGFEETAHKRLISCMKQSNLIQSN
tara:strand:- start:104 stop:376 length:273 start_codon:yes stop_codon:yes gene_type:complete